MNYTPAPSPGSARGTGGVVASVALGLAIGLAWQLLLIQTDWRLGFSPPVWEIVVGWLGFSGFTALIMVVFIMAGIAFYSTNTVARNPQSWDARQSVFETKRRAAGYILGSGGLMVVGTGVMWVASTMGPEFASYRSLARFTMVLGIVTAAGAYFYLKRDPEAPPL